MMGDGKKIAVLGGGAWGSALASHLTGLGHGLHIWLRDRQAALSISKGISPGLGDMKMHPPVYAGDDIGKVLDGTGVVLVVLPAAATRDAVAMLEPVIARKIPVAFAAKGLVGDDGENKDLLICEYAGKHLPRNPVVMLSGPSFADEVMAGKPAALVAASDDGRAADAIAGLFNVKAKVGSIRVYTGDDPVGTAVGGAIKNVIAIAAGITEGLGLGDNAKAALITRGLAEATRFAVAMGGRAETLAGLAGIGDMALSCASPHSRNFAFGLGLARGDKMADKLTEGRHAADAILRRAESLGVEMPITAAISRVLAGGDIASEITRLMLRPVGKGE